MYTVSDILQDIDRGCLANNMVEDMFQYRITFYINEGNKGKKCYLDSSYRDLRKSLEYIIRKYLSTTNSVVIAQTMVLKNGKSVCLQDKAYVFCLDEYFRRIKGDNVGKKSLRYAIG